MSFLDNIGLGKPRHIKRYPYVLMVAMAPLTLPDAFLIVGPTASGKSHLAVALAECIHGVVLNADSRQLYHAFPILAALPDHLMKARAPHKLYGILNSDHSCSVALWVDALHHALRECADQKKIPILVGGTGFYAQAFLKGIPSIPPLSEAVQNRIDQASQEGRDLWAWLDDLDPERAWAIHPHDTYRLNRALGVILETGRSISDFNPVPWAIGSICVIAILPPRDILRERIDQRLHQMIQHGALDEVRPFITAPEHMPALSTLGVRPFLNVVRGEQLLEHAIQKIYEQTCQYAKRQNTWFKNKLQASITINHSIDEKNALQNAFFLMNQHYSNNDLHPRS